MLIDTSFEELFVEFGDVLRKADQSVGSDDILAFCTAVSELNPTDLVDIYWSGRITLVHKKDSLPIYTQKFREFFLNADSIATDSRKKKIQATSVATASFDIPDVEEGTPSGGEEEKKMGFVSSTTDIFRTKEFKDCSPEELIKLRQLMRFFKISPPQRVTRRFQPKKNGNKVSMRRIAKEVMRNHGEIKNLLFADKKRKLRPIVFILDVSGSMGCPAGKDTKVTCMDVSVSLGLYLADKNKGAFKDTFLTFSGSPELITLKGNIVQQVQQMVRQ